MSAKASKPAFLEAAAERCPAEGGEVTFSMIIYMRNGWRATIRRPFTSSKAAAKALTDVRAYLRHSENLDWSTGYTARTESDINNGRSSPQDNNKKVISRLDKQMKKGEI